MAQARARPRRRATVRGPTHRPPARDKLKPAVGPRAVADMPRVEPPPGVVVFQAYERGKQVSALLGDGAATLTSGFGGWQEVERARAMSLSEWQGISMYRLTVPVLFDGFPGTSVESSIRALEQMAQPTEDGEEPPVLRVYGWMPHDTSRNAEREWVIESLEWGDALRSPAGYHRVRAAVTVGLMEHVDADRLAKIRYKRKKRAPRTRPYKIKPGDTLQKIAATVLKKRERWREILKLNPKLPKDGKLGQKWVGKQIKIPTGRKKGSGKDEDAGRKKRNVKPQKRAT